MWLRHGSGLVMAGMLWGCTTMMLETTPQSSEPVFHADTTDTALFQTVHREQETLLSNCAQRHSCDQVHFTRGMIALFQNGESAAAYFQQAIAVAPKGPFADSSASWIRFLSNRTSRTNSVDELPEALAVIKGLVRTWLIQQRASTASVALRAEETAKSPKLAVRSLQRRIRDRDKRIAELTDQLSALKRIDLEAHRASKLNLPSTLSK